MEAWQIAASVATIVQTIAVIVSLFFIWKQVRQQTLQLEQQTKLAKTANAQALFEMASPFNMQVIQERSMAELIFEGHKNYESFDEVNKFRYKGTLTWRLAFQELMYYQNKKDLLDTFIYQAWEDDFKTFIKRRELKSRWAELEQFYNPEFRSYVSETIEKVDSGHE